MRLLLLGAPGSGKGTQARRLAERFALVHLATGDLLRSEVAAATPLGEQVRGYLDAGELVPDDVVERLVAERVEAIGSDRGYVLDGFPRTLHQATVSPVADVDAAVHLDVPDDVLLTRLLSRGENRSDDRARTIRRRLAVYHERTEPLIAFYAERGVLHAVDGTREPDQVFAAVVAAVPR